MKIKMDRLLIRHGARDDAGERIEPEQQPVQRVLTTDLPADMQQGGRVGAIRGEVIYHSTAGQMAAAVRSLCKTCVAEGTIVLTNVGAIPIERAEGIAQTFVEGAWQDVAAWMDSGVKEVVEITTTHGARVVATPDHRFLTARGWVAAGDLRAAFRPSGQRDNRDEVATLVPMGGGKDLLSRDEALLTGLIVGDGHRIRKDGRSFGVGLSFEPSMGEALAPILAYAAERFGSREKPRAQRHKPSELCPNESTRPIHVMSWRTKEAGRFAAQIDKGQVPQWLWFATPECRAAYLRGLFTTDGSMTLRPRPTARFYQTSETLIEGVRLLLRSLGIYSTMHREIRSPRYKDLFSVTIARQRSLERFVSLISFLDAARGSPLTAAVRERRGKDRQSPERIRAIRPLGPMRTFDISVPATSSFYANGVQVHNCRFFDHEAWIKYRDHCERSSSLQKRGELNALRAQYATTQNTEIINRSSAQSGPGSDGEMDVEHVLSLLGICRPLTEIHHDAVIVDPLGSCPEEVCGPDRPEGLYEPRDRAAEREGSTNFDSIMNQACGQR